MRVGQRKTGRHIEPGIAGGPDAALMREAGADRGKGSALDALRCMCVFGTGALAPESCAGKPGRRPAIRAETQASAVTVCGEGAETFPSRSTATIGARSPW